MQTLQTCEHTTFNLKHDGKQPHIKFYIQKVWQEIVILLHKIFSYVVCTRTKASIPQRKK
jgi:hypothetical protein